MLTFFFFGDSLTLGVNDPDMLGWTGRLFQHVALPVPPTTVYNLGVRRQTSRAVSQRWQNELLARKLPESDLRLMFSFGVVDTVAKGATTALPHEESMESLRQILQGLKDVCLPRQVRILSPFPVKDEGHCRRIEHLHLAYQQLCRQKGIKYVDVFNPLIAKNEYLRDLADGIHPGAAGCAILSKLLLTHDDMQNWLKA